MYWHVIAHSQHLAVGVVNGAGIIAAFFYIGRKCGTPENGTHFFCDGMKDIFKYFQARRVRLGDCLTHKILPRWSDYLESTKFDRSCSPALSSPGGSAWWRCTPSQLPARRKRRQRGGRPAGRTWFFACARGT